MRSLMLAAFATLSFASAASAITLTNAVISSDRQRDRERDVASPQLYTADSHGRCHDRAGHPASPAMCHQRPAPHCARGKSCHAGTDVAHRDAHTGLGIGK